ncbi:MAG: BtrH N-terminal domain-containing protein [Deltaproteobacteria bacterium]|nr:BtrH N-terminal domain-containing protein [Deltaproteobacteria bacterium]
MTLPAHADTTFRHRLAAHCESGVASLLLEHSGVALSEPLAFGIGSGLFFFYLPFERWMAGPTTTFRTLPGTIFRKACRRLGIGYESRTYRAPQRGFEDLRALVDRGTPVGLQTSVYWLTYLPRRFRFQFNGHNIVVYGRRGDTWLVSDPVLDAAVECPEEALRRARFARGAFAPRGRLYYLTDAPAPGRDRLRRAVLAGARETAYRMARVPVPILGSRGIRLLAGNAERWPARFPDPADALVKLANIVRMLEEIGTGGAGFRYLEAAFLQEAGVLFEDDAWGRLSERLTAVGDGWRQFSLKAARICKSGRADPGEFRVAADLLREQAAAEQEFFEDLYRFVEARRCAS